MSGGYFNYDQCRISSIASEVQNLIDNNKETSTNSYGDPIGRDYSEETITRFKEAVLFLEVAAIYAQRVDWLVSGDDSEESFRKRLSADLKNYEGVK